MPNIRTGDIDTWYTETGTGKPIILVHGGWLDHRMWNLQTDSLSKDYRLIAYDMRGHGKTPFGEQPYTIEQLATDLKNLTDALCDEPPVIIGLSLGGMVAQTYAVNYPNNLRALILAGTAATVDLGFPEKLIKHVFMPKWLFKNFINLLGVSFFAKLIFRLAGLSRKSRRRVEDGKGIATYALEELDKHTINSFSTIMLAVYDFTGLPTEVINVPTLLISGEKDSFLVKRQMKVLHQRIKGSRWKVVPSCAHLPNLEKPYSFNQRVLMFLQNDLKAKSTKTGKTVTN